MVNIIWHEYLMPIFLGCEEVGFMQRNIDYTSKVANLL